MSESTDSPSPDSSGILKRKCSQSPSAKKRIHTTCEITNQESNASFFLSPQSNALLTEFDSMETTEHHSKMLQKDLVKYFCVTGEMLKELTIATEKMKCLEDLVQERNHTIHMLKADCGVFKNGLKLKNAEIQLLRKSVASSSSADDDEEMGKNEPILHECYKKCTEENRELILKVETLKLKLESCQERSRINQKNLYDENQELKTKLELLEEHRQILMLKEKMSTEKLDEACNELLSLKTKMYDMEGNFDELSRTLEARVNDVQDLEALNKVLLSKEREVNDELQEARKKSISVLQDSLTDGPIIGIKRMGELNEKSFQEVCKQKFPDEEWGMKSGELCSLWQEKVTNPQWYPFKIYEKMGKFVEIIDDNDDDLKELKNDLGDEVYKAVCVALAEINDYNPSTRSVVSELWNFKEDRKAQIKEVVEYMENLVLVPKKKITRSSRG